MFCAGCGTQIQSGLNYCSRCGRRIAEESKSGKTHRTNPLTIAGNTAGVGFVGFIFIIGILMKYGAMPNILVPITFFYFAALFGICFMIMRHGANVRAAVAPLTEEKPEPSYLRPVTTAQLEEAREFSVGSVTDATTRTLDKVPIDQQRN